MSKPTGHPKGLYLLFVTEMWERFSYYGMRAIFFLYITKALLMSNMDASSLYGSYTSLVYLTPLLGGYLADRYLGNRKSIIIGGLMMAIGQFFMYWSASNYEDINSAYTLMMLGLGLLITGNGFFKPNISTMVGQLYEPNDKRMDSAFTIFYMGINAGALLSPLICGTLGDTNNNADFRWGFLAAAIGMLLSLGIFIALKNKYLVTPDNEPIGVKPNLQREHKQVLTTDTKTLVKEFSVWGIAGLALFFLFFKTFDFDFIGSFVYASCIVVPGFIVSDKSLSKVERSKIWVIYIIAFFVIFFWSAFEQAGASLTYFAEVQTDRSLNLFLPIQLIVVIAVILLAGFAYLLYKCLPEIKKSFLSLETVYATFILSISGLVIYGLVPLLNSGSQGIQIDSMPASYFQSFNPIIIVAFAPLLVLLWGFLSKRGLEPNSPSKQALGLLLLALGYLFIAYGVKDIAPNAKASMLWLTGLYFIHTMGELCLSPIGLSMVNKLSPARFASLLMGVWFLSTATANKFAGTLSALYPEEGMPTPSILGYQVENLYDFFMIFVVMAGIAALILFGLSSWLNKKMEEE